MSEEKIVIKYFNDVIIMHDQIMVNSVVKIDLVKCKSDHIWLCSYQFSQNLRLRSLEPVIYSTFSHFRFLQTWQSHNVDHTKLKWNPWAGPWSDGLAEWLNIKYFNYLLFISFQSDGHNAIIARLPQTG